ncbi:hypothetical protein GCM10023310_23920 [Paenibacillus vulneris]
MPDLWYLYCNTPFLQSVWGIWRYYKIKAQENPIGSHHKLWTEIFLGEDMVIKARAAIDWKYSSEYA